MKFNPAWLPHVTFVGVTLGLFVFQWLLARLASKHQGALRHSADYRFDPINEDALPAAARRWFDKHTPGMLACRLELLGDFRLTASPASPLARFFASREGQYYGCIERHPLLPMRGKTYSFFSVFSDGTYLESAALFKAPGTPDPMGVLRFEYVPRASVRELLAHHQQAIQQLEAGGARQCLAFAPDQFRELANYGHRLVGWDLHAKGVRLVPPEPREAATVSE